MPREQNPARIQMMKLLVLSESPNHVSCRYRVLAFEPALRRAGWEVAVRPLSCTVTGFFRILCEAARSDVVLVQRRLLSPEKVGLLRRCARRLIYDIDDAVFLRDSNSSKPAESRRRDIRFRAIVRAADAVIAGNEYLAESAARCSQQTRVELIPTCVDPDAYPVQSNHRRGDGLRLAWIGSASTLPSLNEIGPALRDAARQVPGLELHVICDRAPELPGVPVVLRRWSPESEAHDLAQCDVGISWLPDHPWSHGKCGLKVLQYMAAGLPVVVNSLGVHPRLVSAGVEGLVIERADDLCGALVRLTGARDLSKRLGLAGRRRVEAEFSIQAWTPTFVRLINSIADGIKIERAA